MREWIDSRARFRSAMTVLCVLPARLGSRRIPRKPLQPIAGRTLVEWSWRAASRIGAFDAVWVATDSEEIARCVRRFGGTALLTRPDHASGTDRVAEVAARPEASGFDVLVNCQADEPFLDEEAVNRAVAIVSKGAAPLATVAAPIRDADEWRSPSVVKVVTAADGTALYFTRAPVPCPREGEPTFGIGPEAPYLRHTGVYVYARAALERWTTLPPSRLERIEKLEQLRALEAGLRIVVVVGAASGPGVDVPADLGRAERWLAETVPIERVEADD